MNKGTTRRMIIMLVLTGMVFGGIYGFQQFRNKMIQQAIRGQGMPPQAVSTATVEAQTWQPTVEAVGTLRAARGASLATEVAGLVTAIHFESGATVKAGQLLVELNAAPLKAQLEQLKAQALLARQNYERDNAQFKVQAISQAVVDTDAANLKSAEAQVASQEAGIGQKTLRAPFAGKLGIRQIDLGQYLAAGSAVVNLQQLDSIYLDFTVPQTQINLIHAGDKVAVQTSALPGRHFSGNVMAIEPVVDTATRNLQVRARIVNTKETLLPGMFATVRVDEGAKRQFITVPNAAIAYNTYGSTVFIVKQGSKGADGKISLTVEQRFVQTGATRGDQVAVLSGLKSGETVVTGGQLKLRNGASVFVNNSVPTANNPNPEVSDE